MQEPHIFVGGIRSGCHVAYLGLCQGNQREAQQSFAEEWYVCKTIVLCCCKCLAVLHFWTVTRPFNVTGQQSAVHYGMMRGMVNTKEE